MKKVYVVSKTHLDLGFTDFSQNVLEKYLNIYIPNAIKTANDVNIDGKKRFVWTTGSWLLLKALENDKNGVVKKALEEGNIAPHAMPFTIHTELLDKESLDYALGLVDNLDKITGTKTVAAKMTDVPGHTISLVPILAKHGIKLLHIGVNGASAMPNVPECFLWHHKETNTEVMVIYSGSYGGEFKCDLVDEVLYFDHTVDNRGARNKEDTIRAFEKIQSAYPDYQVEAGRMDDFANAIWKVRHKLPVVTSEIGDTWIHGVGTDPYKVALLKEIICAKNVLNFDKESEEYKRLMDGILCTAEHTWGGDSKIFLSDYCHYDKKGFKQARKNDDTTLIQQVLDTEYGKDIVEKRKTGEYKAGSYAEIEKTWAEQRKYGALALECLPKETADLIKQRLKICFVETENNDKNQIAQGDIKIEADKNGCVDFYFKKRKITSSDGRTPIRYMSFCADDYDVWSSNYTRDFDDNHLWSWADFCRPFLHQIDGQYKFGEYQPKATKVFVKDNQLVINYQSDSDHYDDLGCAKDFQFCYSIAEGKIKVCVQWKGKEACRVPEMTSFCIYPANTTSFSVTKAGYCVDTKDIVKNGSRRLFACENVMTKDMKIINHHSPLCIGGFCNLVRFSNEYPSIEDGISFVLHNNIWGTNFPLWYEDDAKFEFTVEFGE